MRTEDMQVDLPFVDTIESEPIEGLTSGTVVLARIGDATSWDVWVEVPAPWIAVASAVFLQVYALTGGKSVLVKEVRFDEGDPVADQSRILCSVRGVPCTAIEIKIRLAGVSSLDGGVFQLNAWSGAEAPSITTPAGPPPIRVRGEGIDGSLVVEAAGGSLEVHGSGVGGSLSVAPQGGSFQVRGLGTGGALTIEPTGSSLVVSPAGGSMTIAPSGGSMTVAPSGGSFQVRGLGTAGALTVEAAGSSLPVSPAGGSMTVSPSGGSMTVAPSGGSFEVHGAGGSLVVEQNAKTTFAVRQSTAGAQSNRWPVFLSDGSAERGTTTNPLVTQSIRSGVLYSAVAGPTNSSTTTNGIATHGVLWSESSTHTGTAEVQEITVSTSPNVSGGRLLIRVASIPNYGLGSVVPKTTWTRGASPSFTPCVAYTSGTPGTRSELFGMYVDVADANTITFRASDFPLPLVLRPNQSEGIEVRSIAIVAPSVAVNVVVTFHWLEV